ncbi:MAG: type I-G CRISPR-associated protein, Cas3-extension family [Acidimicrobiia bacterium]
MSRPRPGTDTVDLTGIDGANPLGFLAALGTLVTLHDAGEKHARLHWKSGTTWTPAIGGISVIDPAQLSEIVARGLLGREVSEGAENECAQAEEQYSAAKKAVKDELTDIRRRKLRGNVRKGAIETEVAPLERKREKLREIWLEALAAAVPRAELALGKRIDCKPAEFREHASAFLARSCLSDRDAVDLLAAFGSDASLNDRTDTIEPTPFQFITGSGHQYFLETVRDLVERVSPKRVHNTLFESWTYQDEKLSMRWDPLEDRRYALMDRDPTSSGNKPRTMWMANLLGYRSLSLFPSAPRRGGLRVVGWFGLNKEPSFTWPLWDSPALPDTIRSLLSMSELIVPQPSHEDLYARGVLALFRAHRIQVGTGSNRKLNFSPARRV